MTVEDIKTDLMEITGEIKLVQAQQAQTLDKLGEVATCVKDHNHRIQAIELRSVEQREHIKGNSKRLDKVEEVTSQPFKRLVTVAAGLIALLSLLNLLQKPLMAYLGGG